MKTRVLYVEDEPSLAKIVSESLISRGYEVIIANNGKEAVDKFGKSQFDACVMDIMMPEMDGYSAAEELLKMDPNVPILFLTAKTQVQDLVKGFETGGRDYIRKPFSMEELIVRIQNVLNHSEVKKVDSEKYIFGEFAFDPKKYEFFVQNGSCSNF